MSALQQVQIGDWNDNPVVTTLFQMLQWKHALKAELKGVAVTVNPDCPESNTPVFEHLLKFLNAPADHDWIVPTMYNYICQTTQALHEMMYEGDTTELDESMGLLPHQVLATIQEAGYEAHTEVEVVG